MLIVNLTLHLSESIQYISPGFVIILQMIGKVINIAVIAILLQYVLWQECHRHAGQLLRGRFTALHDMLGDGLLTRSINLPGER